MFVENKGELFGSPLLLPALWGVVGCWGLGCFGVYRFGDSVARLVVFRVGR